MRLATSTLGAALLALAAVATPASAQTQAASGGAGSGPLTGIEFGGKGAVDEADLQKRREIDEAYQKAIRSAPAAQTTAVNDPWANMRGADEQKPAAKPAPKTAQKKKPAQ